jgi:hypothetical protein
MLFYVLSKTSVTWILYPVEPNARAVSALGPVQHHQLVRPPLGNEFRCVKTLPKLRSVRASLWDYLCHCECGPPAERKSELGSTRTIRPISSMCMLFVHLCFGSQENYSSTNVIELRGCWIRAITMYLLSQRKITNTFSSIVPYSTQNSVVQGAKSCSGFKPHSHLNRYPA